MSVDESDDLKRALERAARRAERERKAREEAERILDGRSRELFQATSALHAANSELEMKVAELKRSREEAWRLANVDPETGLASRAWVERAFYPELDAQLPLGAQAALILVRLDSAQAISEAFGPVASDCVATAAASRLLGATPPGWSLARLSSDAFLFCTLRPAGDGVDLGAETDALGEALGAAFDAVVDFQCSRLRTSFQAGAAVAPEDALSVDGLRRAVDLALSAARRDKRPRYRRFREGMQEEARLRWTVACALPEAISSGLIEVWHQPKINLETQSVAGVEALSRWRKEDGDVTSPDTFIPIAEENALIVDLGRAVMARALEDIGRWRQLSLCETVAVNVSLIQLRSADFAEEVIAALNSAGQPPEALQIEVTESAVLEDHETARAVLGKLRALGVSIALDDFGSGVSNHTLIRELPIDTIKIDRSFVQQIGKSAFARTVVDNILQLAHALDMTVVAEGVERAEHLAFLKVRGCQYAQGYYWSRPTPAAECEQFMRARRARRHRA